MTVIDINAKLAKTKEFKIADRTYTVTISDKVDRAISNLVNIETGYTALNIGEKAEKLAEQEGTTAETMKEFMVEEADILKDKVIAVLDVILGEKQGEYIYNYYGQSTKTLMAIIRFVSIEVDKITIERKEYAKGKYSNRHKNNKK